MATVFRSRSRRRIYLSTSKSVRPPEAHYVPSGEIVLRREFVPLDRARRFAIVEFQGSPWEYIGGPRHLLDLPPNERPADFFANHDFGSLTREEGFAGVAANNRARLEVFAGSPHLRLSVTSVRRWQALVEFGSSTEPVISVKMQKSGIGLAVFGHSCLVRLAVPTVKDCERHSLTIDEWEHAAGVVETKKGGAA